MYANQGGLLSSEIGGIGGRGKLLIIEVYLWNVNQRKGDDKWWRNHKDTRHL